MLINELGSCPTRSDNVYFADNEEALLVFTAAFCFAHAEYNLIKPKLRNDWSASAVDNISESAMWNSSKPINFLTFKNYSINKGWIKQAHVIEIMYSCFYESKKLFGCSMQRSMSIKKKNRIWFWLTFKSCS